MSLFTGLSAFPLTPLADDEIHEAAFVGLIQRLSTAGVDSITVLGSTGSYAYLTAYERDRIAHLAVEHAGTTPVFVGIGALRTSQILTNIDSAQRAGAAGLLLAPMTYQPLTEHDVLELFDTVTQHTDLPIIVYDNPGTTHFTFSTELYARIAALPGIASLKIPGVPAEPAKAREHVTAIRAIIPDHVTIGVSGDAFAANGLTAGCDAWYSVIGGTLPDLALAITRAIQQHRNDDALQEAQRLTPLWHLFTGFGGSLRVTAAIAEYLGLVPYQSLPLPIQGLSHSQRARVAEVVDALELSR